jgi:hypothetical protein
VVGGCKEDESEGALDVDEYLVPEPSAQRHEDRHGHRPEREHAGEDRPAGVGPQQIERGVGGDGRPTGEDQHYVAEQEREGNLAVDAVRLVHAVEAAEERFDETQPGAENEVERERRRPGERAEDGDARQRCERAVEARVERGASRPEDEGNRAQHHQHERASKESEPHASPLLS